MAAAARRVPSAFQKSFLIDSYEINTTISFGIAIYSTDGKDAATLIRNTDITMYRTKEKGRNNCKYFTPPMDVEKID